MQNFQMLDDVQKAARDQFEKPSDRSGKSHLPSSRRRQSRKRETRRDRLRILFMLLLGGAIIAWLIYLNLRN